MIPGRYLVVAALAMLAGCSVDHDARNLIQPFPALRSRASERPAWIEFWGRQQTTDGAAIAYWGIRHKTATTTKIPTTAPASGRGTVLILHPMLADKSWFAPLGCKLAAAGWDVVLVDARGHGESSDSFITWGAKEKDDLKGLMDTAIRDRHLSDRVFAFGASMGGCVAIQYAAYDPRCRGVLALAPPKSFAAVARLTMPFRDAASLQERIDRTGQIGGFDPKQASAVDAAAHLRCPLILVHGQADMVVPFDHAKAIFAAAPEPKRLIALPFVDHLTVQVGRDAWLMERMDELDKMAREAAGTISTPPTTAPAATTIQPAATQPDAKAVADLVAQLNHREFKVREAATKQLIAVGGPVFPLLEARLNDPEIDPEVALRIKTVLSEVRVMTVKLSDEVSIKFVRIPTGKFMMGSLKEEKGRKDNEGSQREVTISKSFYMGVYEVTQEQYAVIMGKNPSHFEGLQNPVEKVSWRDAVEFCKKASEITGKKFRLPTEAEWEYACRAGSETRFCSGDDDNDMDDYGWNFGNSGIPTHPVGRKKPNAWGLYDMHGNVGEWCSDRFSDSDSTKYIPPDKGLEDKSGGFCVIRGGSIYGGPDICRSAARFVRPPGVHSSVFGFRVVVSDAGGE